MHIDCPKTRPAQNSQFVFPSESVTIRLPKSRFGPPQKRNCFWALKRAWGSEWNGVRSQFEIHSTEDEAAEVAGRR
jgi:hypothetical protein